jgi:alpha-galactosidase
MMDHLVRHVSLIVFLAIPLPVFADDRREIPTDFELVRTTIVNALNTHLRNLPLPPDASITVASEGTKDENNWIVEHEITKSLLDKGYHVVATSHQDTLSSRVATDSTTATMDTSQTIKSLREISSPTTPYSLLFRIGDLKLNYKSQSILKLFRKSIRRSVILSLTLRIVDHHDGTTLWASWINDSQSDSVPKHFLSTTETLKSVKKQTLSSSGKWAEFLTAAGMMAGIIFVAF